MLPPHRDDTPSPAVVQLTRRLASGNESAFREFHTLYFDRLYRFLLVVTHGQTHAAQDALQETFLRVARHAREFATEEALWSWLRAIARNTARDVGRKQRRYLALLESFSFRHGESPNGATIPDENRLRDLLDECLSAIDEPDRTLVAGKYLRGSTVAELAAETGLSEKAVESRLLRTRRTLAENLLAKLSSL
ncbi:MAG: sigma-70 family RNA polymerase sigma factor [Opitutaceae bacterium]